MSVEMGAALIVPLTLAWLVAGSSLPIQPSPELVPTLTVSTVSHFDLGNTIVSNQI